MGTRKKVMLIFGTRPDAIKMCPLAIELRGRDAFDTVVCVTGQHDAMLHQVLDVFGVAPDYDLAIMKERQTLFDITENVFEALRPVLEREAPDIVLVHGDTTTAYAAALTAFYMNIAVGHVEAGLRTDSVFIPFPEEFNRRSVDLISRLSFAPTAWSAENLRREGKPEDEIVVTGNTVIDAMRYTIKKSFTHPILDWAAGSRLILMTAHRRENIGAPMRALFSGIARLVADHPDVKLAYAVHPNPAVRQLAEEYLGGRERILLTEPLDAVAFQNVMDRAYFILTDSGGIQEEASAIGKPVLLMRDNTERPEGVEAGTIRLAGTTEEGVYREGSRLLDDPAAYDAMHRAANPYGDGYASRYIADALERWFAGR